MVTNNRMSPDTICIDMCMPPDRSTYNIRNVCNLETFGKHEMKIDTTNLRVNFAIE